MTYYKVLNNGRGPFADFDYSEYLPKNGKPGRWLPKIGKLELCKSGYHVTDAEHLIDWIDGDQLYEVEVKGKVLEGDNKITCQQIRLIRQVDGWNDENLRLFACWCTEQMLQIYEEKHPDDNRHRAIETARRYAVGLATDGELAAASAAVRAAARNADSAVYRAVACAASYADMAAASAAARNAQSVKLQEIVFGYTA